MLETIQNMLATTPSLEAPFMVVREWITNWVGCQAQQIMYKTNQIIISTFYFSKQVHVCKRDLSGYQ
jgi:hypothetical protein